MQYELNLHNIAPVQNDPKSFALPVNNKKDAKLLITDTDIVPTNKQPKVPPNPITRKFENQTNSGLVAH